MKAVCMRGNEAEARIKINKRLGAAGWRFFPEGGLPANIFLELNVQIQRSDLESMGNDFEGKESGKVDYLLTDSSENPLIVLEAKAESKNPLEGKEQARKYAKSLNCRYVILSNGNQHYFWDLEYGNPYIVTEFPSQQSIGERDQFKPDPKRLAAEKVEADYIALTQNPRYASDPDYKNERERPKYIQKHELRFLRDYQLRAVRAVQKAVENKQDRFLFEMATGTGKTLVAAAIIKLFLQTQNASRVLFLVDRIELEKQAADKAFKPYLKNDFDTVIYKENRNDWRKAQIVVSTVQSLLSNNKYRTLFSPTDFNLVISDEAHRSINGNARAVFDYFVGYKLGLTATPKDYLKGTGAKEADARDPREMERRLLRDTYRTFGCESQEPTFRYSLIDGVRGGYLISPTAVDIRTEVTTQLLADKGYHTLVSSGTNDDEDADQETFEVVEYKRGDFEKRFFSEQTNETMCEAFLKHAIRDPVSGEIGKSVVFAVSQNHAAKTAQILNKIAHRMFPGKYQSDFAVQVTSHIQDAQQFAVNFANNRLNGTENFMPGYRTSKTRVCVTVGMMTTGYDCPDLLNLALFRPIFSPTDFVQIKGRGTRKHDFSQLMTDRSLAAQIEHPEKTTFKLFDFFGNWEYFEDTFNYDEAIELPARKSKARRNEDEIPTLFDGVYEREGEDPLKSLREEEIGPEGMKVDRMLFNRFADQVRSDDILKNAVENEQWDFAENRVRNEHFDKPEDYFNLLKLRKSVESDRRVSLREFIELVFNPNYIIKTKKELIDEEFDKFSADHAIIDPEQFAAAKRLFETYIASAQIRDIIDKGEYARLATNPGFNMSDLSAVPEEYRQLIPNYIKDYVPLNRFLD